MQVSPTTKKGHWVLLSTALFLNDGLDTSRDHGVPVFSGCWSPSRIEHSEVQPVLVGVSLTCLTKKKNMRDRLNGCVWKDRLPKKIPWCLIYLDLWSWSTWKLPFSWWKMPTKMWPNQWYVLGRLPRLRLLGIAGRDSRSPRPPRGNTRPGERLHFAMENHHFWWENHHFLWENPLFQWPFSIAFC